VSYFRPRKTRKTGPRSIRSFLHSTQKLSRKAGRVKSGNCVPIICAIQGVHPKDFSPTSVQFKNEINGAFLCKRHQEQHLEFLTALLRTRRPGVRIPPGAPLLVNKTKAI